MHHGLIRKLVELAKSQETGILEVRSENARTRLYLADGVIVLADEGAVAETLGRILTREKILAEADYEHVLEAMAQNSENGESSRFGEIVVKLGFLTQAQVDAALAAQVQHKVLNCLRWQDATLAFEKHAALAKGLARFPTELEPILIRALRVMTEDAKRDLLEPHIDATAVLSADAATIAALFRLKTPEARFVRLIDGKTTVGGLLDMSVPDFVDPWLLLCVLNLAGHLTYLPGTSPLKTETPFERRAPLAMKKKKDEKAPASEKQARKKISALRSAVHRLADAQKKEMKRAAIRLRTHDGRVSRASIAQYLPAASTEHGVRLVAEQHFRKGRKLLRQNKLNDALTALKRAVDMVPTAAEYRLYAAWTTFRLLPEREAERVGPLRGIAKRALKEDSELGFAYYVLGHIAMREGNHAEAHTLLAMARSLDGDGIDGEKPLVIAPATRGSLKFPTPAVPPRPVPLPAASHSKLPAAPAKPTSLPKTASAKTQTSPVNAPIAKSATNAAQVASDTLFVLSKATPTATLKVKSEDEREREAMPIVAPPPSESDPFVLSQTPAPAPHLAPTATAPATTSRASDDPVSKGITQTQPKSRAALYALAALVAVVIALFAAKGKLAGALETPVASASPKAEATPSTTNTSPTSTQAATPTWSSTLTSSSTATPSPTSSSTPTPAAPSPTLHATTGTMKPPAYAQGRRVFVDGKVASEGAAPIEVSCGSHVVQIGSSGKPRTVDVPCGGTLPL